MPLNKTPKRDSGSCVSKMGVNPHEIVGIRLDDTSKQGLMHEHVSKLQKCKEVKKAKRVAQSKHNITQSRERRVSSTPT